MKEPIVWKDHVVEYPNRYVETDLGDGYIDHVKSPGEIIQPGTPLNADKFNDMDLAAIQGILLGLSNADYIRKLLDKTDTLEEGLEEAITDLNNKIAGDWITVNLTNSQSYPFNNSKKTVNLSPSKKNTDYSVYYEVISHTGGSVGDIEISDKLQNGFKIAFTGSATNVTVRCKVQGGF